MKYFYYHKLDPVIFNIGSISLYWYGVMYCLGFMFAMWFLSYRSSYCNNYPINKINEEIEYLFYLNIFGVLIGGRIGYVIFYQLPFFSKNLLWVFNIREGGMSFHGGLIGVILSILWFSYQRKQDFLRVSDFIAPAVPFGLGLGRIGNFINGELWGKVVTDAPLAVFFPKSINQDLLVLKNYPQWQSLFNYYGVLPRHPSQLYEMFLEGIILFIILNIYDHKPRPVGSVSGLFLICYGIFRIIVEFFRQPDSQIGFIYNMYTMGQILSIPMVIFGLTLICLAHIKKNY